MEVIDVNRERKIEPDKIWKWEPDASLKVASGFLSEFTIEVQ